MFRREAHVDEVQVEGFPARLAVLGWPAAIGLFMNLECCNHVIAFLLFVVSIVFVGSPSLDGGKLRKVEVMSRSHPDQDKHRRKDNRGKGSP
jgi:hypothetical protein